MNHLQHKMHTAALAMMEKAYAPYSNFPVGACILASNGELYTGCNIENAAFGLTLCAEASAIANMVIHGQRQIKKIVVVANSNEPCAPCGACRQRILEFATPDTEIHFYNRTGKHQMLTMQEILPAPFEAKTLEDV